MLGIHHHEHVVTVVHEAIGTDPEQQIVRHLADANSLALIAWYCFIGTTLCPTITCLFYFWYHKWRSHRRAMQTLHRALEMETVSQIEANVQAFSEAEKTRRTRQIKAILQHHRHPITEVDLFPEPTAQTSRRCSQEGVLSCGICLEEFTIGELAIQSPTDCCHQLVHEECILAWLVTERHELCPFCRRPFLGTPLRATSSFSTMPRDMTSDDAAMSSRLDSSGREGSGVDGGGDGDTGGSSLDVEQPEGS
eukprot:Nitzschia sp. Nitz4//scaffold92_size79448//14147//14899//NITZ4_005384-RA/size79448-processed-gene-0.68-mRNA-1//-1//CDS//3329560165//2247//frame0